MQATYYAYNKGYYRTHIPGQLLAELEAEIQKLRETIERVKALPRYSVGTDAEGHYELHSPGLGTLIAGDELDAALAQPIEVE